MTPMKKKKNSYDFTLEKNRIKIEKKIKLCHWEGKKFNFIAMNVNENFSAFLNFFRS